MFEGNILSRDTSQYNNRCLTKSINEKEIIAIQNSDWLENKPVND